HVSPEGASGGIIGLVEDGDEIEIDIPNYSIRLLVDDGELERRRANWTAPEPRIKTGWLARYGKLVSSASEGATLQ
ncbi:MAG: dihydroxy-acid dehydratase, partial [Oscillospiraceae bacterium]|nr:dihydroxy-acid dehydratase [Oscillospiraceae bacterium]